MQSFQKYYNRLLNLYAKFHQLTIIVSACLEVMVGINDGCFVDSDILEDLLFIDSGGDRVLNTGFDDKTAANCS